MPKEKEPKLQLAIFDDFQYTKAAEHGIQSRVEDHSIAEGTTIEQARKIGLLAVNPEDIFELSD
jgi:hypothetical protein